MLAKRFASIGSCLTMSPPEKTASMYIHMFWTTSQPSMTSDTTDSMVIHLATSSRQKALYLLVLMLASVIWLSSSRSTSSTVGAGSSTKVPRVL